MPWGSWDDKPDELQNSPEFIKRANAEWESTFEIHSTRQPGWTMQEAADKAVEGLTATKADQSLSPHIDFELTININRKHKVKGTRVGDLLVHEHVDMWGSWQISHVPTLVSFMGAVPEGNWSHDQLVDWAKRVQQNLRVDWEKLAELTFDNYNDFDDYRYQYAKDRIKKYCLSIPVDNSNKW